MSGIDNLTDAVAATSIKDSSAAGANAAGGEASTAVHTEAVIAVVAEGRRLYIGNLAYATTEGELNEFFKDYLVESTSIPTNPRTTRPVGYAFVDLSTSTEAQRAMSELSGKEILSRKVSVQLARKPETAAERAEAAHSGGEGVSGGEGTRRRLSGRGRGRGRGRGGRTGRGGRSRQADEGPNTITDAEVLPLTDTTASAVNAQNVENGQKEAADAAKDNKPRTPRPTKQRGPPEDGIPSKIKVMVANLPYDLSEDKLKELFTAYNPSAAKIALRPIPRFMVKKLEARNEPRKGRGFGFVSLESEEMQQRAVAEMNGKEIEGREIAVKIAIDSPGKEDMDREATAPENLKENGVAQHSDVPAPAAA